MILINNTRSNESSINKNNNNDDDVFTLQFSSDTPINMGGYTEVLDHSNPSNINLERLKNGALLVDHDRTMDKLVGVVLEAWIENGKGYCTVKFSSSELGQQIKTDIENGIINSVSAGYSIDEYIHDESENIYTATKWTVIEVSIVACPADISCTVQRSEEEKENTRIRSIIDAGKNCPFEVGALIKRSIKDGLSVDEFKQQALNELNNNAPKETININIGMKEEMNKYNLNNVIRSLAGDKSVDIGYELEQQRELELQGHRSTGQGVIVPVNALINQRSLNTAAGAGIVAEEQRPDLFIDALRPHSVCVQAGVTMLNGLMGKVSIPKLTETSKAYWLDLDGVDEIPNSNPTIASVNLNMKSLAAVVPITHAMLKQSTIATEQLIKNDLLKVLATELDRAVIAGTGAGNQPVGILQTVNIHRLARKTKTGTLAPTYAELVELFGLTALANADTSTGAYLFSPDIAAKLMATFIDAGTGIPIFNAGKVAGQNAFYSNAAPINTSIFGNWSDVVVGTWGSIEIAVDPNYSFNQGTIAVRVIHDCDIAIRNPESFATIATS